MVPDAAEDEIFVSGYAWRRGSAVPILRSIFGVAVRVGDDQIHDVLVQAFPVLLGPHEPPYQGDDLNEGVDRECVIHACGGDGEERREAKEDHDVERIDDGEDVDVDAPFAKGPAGGFHSAFVPGPDHAGNGDHIGLVQAECGEGHDDVERDTAADVEERQQHDEKDREPDRSNGNAVLGVDLCEVGGQGTVARPGPGQSRCRRDTAQTAGEGDNHRQTDHGRTSRNGLCGAYADQKQRISRGEEVVDVAGAVQNNEHQPYARAPFMTILQNIALGTA